MLVGLFQYAANSSNNRSWLVHESFAEAVERLFCEAYLPLNAEDLDNAVKNVESQVDCEALKLKRLHVQLGKTPQFWMTSVDFVDRQ